jgi:hypothetical protein
MAHIHFTGDLTAKAEEDGYSRRRSFYVRRTDSQSARAYLPARDASHARRIADAINGVTCEPCASDAPQEGASRGCEE